MHVGTGFSRAVGCASRGSFGPYCPWVRCSSILWTSSNCPRLFFLENCGNAATESPVIWRWPETDLPCVTRGVLETAAGVQRVRVGSMVCISPCPSGAHPARTDISASTPPCSTAVLEVQASFSFGRSKIYKSVTLLLCYITGLVMSVLLRLVLLQLRTLWRCALCGWCGIKSWVHGAVMFRPNNENIPSPSIKKNFAIFLKALSLYSEQLL